MINVLALLIGFVLGSIPFSYIAARAARPSRKVDLRQQGSRNVGATNVYILTGKKTGLAALLLDILKGLWPVLIAQYILRCPNWVIIGSGFLAIAGHNWPVFLRFRGGRGAATTIGVLIALFPWAALIVGFIMFLLWLWTRKVMLSLAWSAFALPLFAWYLPPNQYNMVYVIGACLILGFVEWRGYKTSNVEFREWKKSKSRMV
jgi:glycerol-3-phosphate acyltransferase PlsY